MTESVRTIFKQNIRILGDMDKAVYYFREQQQDKALCLVANSVDQIKSVIDAIITDREYFHLVTTDSVLEMLSGILKAKKNEDYILLADLLELQLINFLIGVQEMIIGKEEIVFNEDNYKENIRCVMERGTGFPKTILEPFDTEELLNSGYRVEFTSCGQMTLAAENEGSKFYFHTNSRIQSEAFLLARHWYQKDKKRYILYGFGMGYHVKELITLAEEAEIEIYEADRNVVQLACAFTNVKEIFENNQIRLIFDPELELFYNRIEQIEPEEALIIHYPSYKNIRSREGKNMIESKLG